MSQSAGEALPLILTAALPPDIQSWANTLREKHFPPERNFLKAHVTLFHALPHFARDELHTLLKELARRPPPPARIASIMDLGGGTAFRIESEEMLAIHVEIAERMHGLLTQQDQQKRRLHITVQNKVRRIEAEALQQELRAAFVPRDFRFGGLSLHAYLGGPWQHLKTYPFRG